MIAYGIRMDPSIIARIRSANEAAVVLVTLLTSDADEEAIHTVIGDPAYSNPEVTMAIATLAVSAIKSLATLVDCEPLDVVRVAGLSAAKYAIDLENREDPS